jgi:hypothetical protein
LGVVLAFELSHSASPKNILSSYYFLVLGLELRAYTLSHFTSPFL